MGLLGISPTGIYSYDLDLKRKTEWVRPQPSNRKAISGSDHKLIHFASFDGRMIPAFVRYPGPEFSRPYPVLVLVHGGPASQYRPGYELLENVLLGELGIALVMPNVRGSTGNGHSYEKNSTTATFARTRSGTSARSWSGSARNEIWTPPAWPFWAGRTADSCACRDGPVRRSAPAPGIDLAGVSHLETNLKTAPRFAIDAGGDEYGDERNPEMCALWARSHRSHTPTRSASRCWSPMGRTTPASSSLRRNRSWRPYARMVRRCGTSALTARAMASTARAQRVSESRRDPLPREVSPQPEMKRQPTLSDKGKPAPRSECRGFHVRPENVAKLTAGVIEPLRAYSAMPDHTRTFRIEVAARSASDTTRTLPSSRN